MTRLLDTIRQHVERSDQSRYAISKATGIDQSQLCRLMDGTGGLSVERLETLVDYLGLEIRIQSKRSRRKGR